MSSRADPFVPRCVIELFAFLCVGADVDRITLLPIHAGDAAAREKASNDVVAAFKKFQVADSDCYAADKDHLLGAVESGFDSLEDFNKACSSALVNAAKRTEYREQLRQGTRQGRAAEGDGDSFEAGDTSLFKGKTGQKSDADGAGGKPMQKSKTMGVKLIESMKFKATSDDELAA
mmetsp:Transcript_45867/g.135560  ORF Transcript_45867/g.135560 Transcript_45867/m.135560 type:complete len:176 (+) Transcript_45867:964-1491(+)